MHPPLGRMADPHLEQLLRVFPVAVVTGARQTGKSTLVRQQPFASDRLYVTLDDVLVREQARRDPELLLDRAERMIIDEVQHAPDLLIAIKRRVDLERQRGRYILTGSANLLLHERVSESLAGRAGYLTLWPLTRREQLGFASTGNWSALLAAEPKDWPGLLAAEVAPAEPWRELALRGGYPTPSYELEDKVSRHLWFEGYSATYLERDIRQLSAIEQLADLRRLMSALCLRLGGLLNQAELARDLALPVSTVQRYINLLEVSYQLVRLPAYSVNRTKRLMKSHKVYWTDTGLSLYLSGETEPRGAHLENLVATDVLAWSSLVTPRPTILHWRTAKGADVDLVIELPRKLLPIEIKASTRVSTDDARHLETFLAEYPEAPAALLLYDGDETFWLRRRVLAAPWWRVL